MRNKAKYPKTVMIERILHEWSSIWNLRYKTLTNPINFIWNDHKSKILLTIYPLKWDFIAFKVNMISIRQLLHKIFMTQHYPLKIVTSNDKLSFPFSQDAILLRDQDGVCVLAVVTCHPGLQLPVQEICSSTVAQERKSRDAFHHACLNLYFHKNMFWTIK